MRLPVVLRYVGFVLLLDAVFLFAASMISLYEADTALLPLLYAAFVAALFGAFPLVFVPPTTSMTNKEGFIIVVFGWLLSCTVGLLPYVLYGGEFNLTNAWFESVSGFTTTGSSILTDVEALPRGLLFWRSATHWIGGTGILIFALSVLPSMGKAGMILYRTEMSPLAAENFLFRTRRTLHILVSVYVGLTAAETLCLLFCGLDLFDAVTQAFGTIATGGFSTKNASIAHFKSLPVEIVIMVFMVLSGIHFGMLFAAASGKIEEVWKSPIVRYYLAALLIGVGLTAINLQGRVYGDWWEAIRYASFQIISQGTSTGFATADSSVWPPFAQLVIIYFTLQCACAGSTSGGIKVDRIVIFWKAVLRRIKSIQHPSAVITVKLHKVSLPDDLVEVTLLFIALYLGIIFLTTLVLSFLGVDALTAFSGSVATMGGVGPGLGSVGSMGNYSAIPDLGKWALTANMLLGRLEIFSIIVFLMPRSWE
jgi:trk system potassium uptake protein TrkH